MQCLCGAADGSKCTDMILDAWSVEMLLDPHVSCNLSSIDIYTKIINSFPYLTSNSMISLTLGYISRGIYFYEYQEIRNVDKNLTLIKYTYKIDANSNKPKA